MFQTLNHHTWQIFFKIQFTNHKLSAHLGIFCQPTNPNQSHHPNHPKSQSLPGLCGLRPGGHGDLPHLGVGSVYPSPRSAKFPKETKPMIIGKKWEYLSWGEGSKLSKRYKCVVLW